MQCAHEIEGLRFNTAIAKLTELNNHLTKAEPYEPNGSITEGDNDALYGETLPPGPASRGAVGAD